MKFLTFAASALLATSASARSTSFFGSSADIAPLDEQYAVPGDNPLEHCADPADDILTIKSVDLEPNPPQAGKNLTITAEGLLSEDIEDGAKVHLEVKYGLIKIISQNADLCETAANVDLECPLKKGPLKLTKVVELPSAIPPGKYSVLADVISKDEDKITCLKAAVTFSRGGAAEGLFKQDM